jgi:hypothetical protein
MPLKGDSAARRYGLDERLAEKEGFEPSRQGFPHLTP